MVKSEEERLAKLSAAAPGAFAPLTADPKGASADRQVDSKGASLPPRPPKTKLGRELCAIRQRIVESGIQLLDWHEIEAEVAARRGERA